jgi:Cu-Zn family superoxide dismutase
MAVAQLLNPEGRKIGIATLSQGAEGVTLVVHVRGLAPGPHALHLHAVGKAEPPEFKSAGPHFNPFGKQHGLKNPHGPHAGDLPNLMVGPDSAGAAVVKASLVILGQGLNSLFDADGSAVVIHEKADDDNVQADSTNTAGNAGKRVACGVVEWLR